MKTSVKFLIVVFCGLSVYAFLFVTTLSITKQHFQNMGSWIEREFRTLKTPRSVRLPDFRLNVTRKDRYNWTNNELSDNKLRKFAPALNETEYVWFLDVIQTFNTRCETFNITYMLLGGSLLGAYRYHGFIPWDEDFDVQVNVSQKASLKKILLAVPGYGLYTNAHFQWKFYKISQGIQTRYKWNWPFVDIFFFDVNRTHVYDVTRGKPKDIYLRSEILPLKYGLFENLILPVPYNMSAYLWKRYPMEDPCKSHWWNHKRQQSATPVRVPCAKLLNVYAIVHRFELGNIAYEDLSLGNKTLYRLQITDSTA